MASGTRQRILDAALAAFAVRGAEATSLDELAAEVGVTKQAILYHFSSKDGLLRSVIGEAARELGEAFASIGARPGEGFDRVEASVRATFRLAARRPEVLGLVRTVARQGGDAAEWMAAGVATMAGRAQAFLEAEMAAGRLRPLEPRILLLAVYSATVGVATEPEVMRVLGLEPDLRSLVRARRQVLDLLRAALVPN